MTKSLSIESSVNKFFGIDGEKKVYLVMNQT